MFRANQEGGRKQVVVFQEHWGPFVFLSFLVTFERNIILHLPVIIELSPFWPYLQTSAFFADTVFQLSRNFFPKSDQGARVLLLVLFPESSQKVYEEFNPWPSGISLLVLTWRASLRVPACPAEPGVSSEAPADPGLSCRQSSASSFAYWYFEFININTENTA